MRAQKTLKIATAAIASIAVAASLYWHLANGPVDFERTLWLRGETATSDKLRLRMADRLVEGGVLLGKSKAEIETMLGPPTTTDKFADYGLVYWLGTERGSFGIDSEWLALNFDQDGKVKDALIVTD